MSVTVTGVLVVAFVVVTVGISFGLCEDFRDVCKPLEGRDCIALLSWIFDAVYRLKLVAAAVVMQRGG